MSDETRYEQSNVNLRSFQFSLTAYEPSQKVFVLIDSAVVQEYN